MRRRYCARRRGLCYAGLGISLWPMMVPPDITIWDAEVRGRAPLGQNRSFFALISANVGTSGARRNGLDASSLAIVEGTVG